MMGFSVVHEKAQTVLFAINNSNTHVCTLDRQHMSSDGSACSTPSHVQLQPFVAALMSRVK